MRYKQYLRQRYRALLGYSGQIIALIGLFHLVPLLLLLVYPQEIHVAGGFILAGAPLVVVGLLAWRWFTPKEPLSLSVQEGSVVVLAVWLLALLSATVPLMYATPLNFVQALFESTSGWTCTGLTVIDVAQTSPIVLFYRSFIQLAGGAGFAIIALSAVAGSFSAGLVAAEGRTDQLAPHVRQSASIVLTMYSGYTILGILALRLAGMDWFDSVNHAFTAVATAGFSTRTTSIGYWDNPAIEAVLIVLMLLGAINFFIAYTFLRGKVRAVIRSGEIRLMTALIGGGAVLLLLVTTSHIYPTLEKAVRVALFELVSALTTTGFSTVDYRTWPDFGWLVLILAMLFGGGTGSTAGGIKLLRIYIVYKAMEWEIRRAFMPRHMINEPAIWQGDRRTLLDDRQVRQVALFIGLYLSVFLVGSGLMMAYGYSLKESLFEFASTLGTTGLSVGVTSPNLPPVLLLAQSFAMLLGRLEFFAVIVGAIKLLSDLRRTL
jgi:trk system potassium uptake protein TrkH